MLYHVCPASPSYVHLPTSVNFNTNTVLLSNLPLSLILEYVHSFSLFCDFDALWLSLKKKQNISHLSDASSLLEAGYAFSYPGMLHRWLWTIYFLWNTWYVYGRKLKKLVTRIVFGEDNWELEVGRRVIFYYVSLYNCVLLNCVLGICRTYSQAKFKKIQ